MKILDLFCGVGGSAKGYKLACENAEITGIDIVPQPNYPYKFIQSDVMQWIQENDITDFDFIHASPPCLAHSVANIHSKNKGVEYADYLQEIITFCKNSKKPYCIENVPQKVMKGNILILQGAYFGLPIIRKRFFQTSFFMMQPPFINQKGDVKSGKVITCAGQGYSKGAEKSKGKLFSEKTLLQNRNYAMGIDWATNLTEINNAVPPLYTKFIFEIFLTQNKLF